MEKISREELVKMYRPDVERMALFLPWLEGKSGADVTTTYDGEDTHMTLAIPVYDSILLEFLNELGSTIFMNQNYRYIYTRYRMKDYIDELNMIEKADIMTFDILCGILSKYTLGGLTKAYLWTQGMENQVFYKALDRARRIIEFYDVPVYVPTLEELAGETESAEEYTTEEYSENGYGEAETLDTVESYEMAEEVAEEIVEEVAEESAEEIVEEVAEEAAEEIAEEVAEETTEEIVEEVVEEATEEIVEEAAEEATEEIVEEVVEETTEEIVEEVMEEVTEESVEETVEETIEEVAEEITEETPTEPAEEIAELVDALDEVEKLLEDTQE